VNHHRRRDNTDKSTNVVAMLQTFKAVLKGNSIERIDEDPKLGDQSIPVHITVLEKNADSDSATRGRRMDLYLFLCQDFLPIRSQRLKICCNRVHQYLDVHSPT
jgi:hypothetical protein